MSNDPIGDMLARSDLLSVIRLQYNRIYAAIEFLTIVSTERHSQGVPKR
jgi:hypothetical protein